MPAAIAMVKKKNTSQVFLSNQSVYHGLVSGNTTAGIRFNIGGTVDGLIGATYTNRFTWLLSGAAADYQILLTTVSGTSPSGSAIATWLALNSVREWSITRSGLAIPGTTESVFTLQIRRVSDSVVIAGPVTITLQCERIAEF